MAPAPFDTAGYLASVRRDGATLASIAAENLDRPVPSCPDWTVGQLIGHTGWVHSWVAATLRGGPDNPPSPKSLERAPEGAAVTAWYRQQLDAMLAAFAEVDLSAELKTFIGPRTGQWWARRMAHETAMHRWDAQAALGTADPIDAALAIDGVDEALDTYVTRRFDAAAFFGSGPGVAQSLHLHATDGEGEWMLTMSAEAISVERAHGKGDTAVRGPACELLLFVMSRRDATHFDGAGVEVFGDGELPARWQAAANF